MKRLSQRNNDQLRAINITRHYTKHAEGSVLVEFGDTKVICTASVIPGVPKFLKGTNKGWITAEYGMLPRATGERVSRENRGGPSGRTQEIQRLIGRSLRGAVDMNLLGENTITIDCDVLQADGGTRTASITGGCVALVDALRYMQQHELVRVNPLKQLVSSVSVGIFQQEAVLDLDYSEDSTADTDMNVVMTEAGGFIEIQGTAERQTFSTHELAQLLELAKKGTTILFEKQRLALK